MAGDRSSKHDASMNNASPPTSGKKSHKRKRDLDGSTLASSTPTKKSKKDQPESSSPVPIREKKKREKQSDSTSSDKTKKKSTKEKGTVSPINDKAKSGLNQKKSKTEKRGTSDATNKDEKSADTVEKIDISEPSKAIRDKDSGKAKKHKQPQVSTPTEGDEDDSNRTKNKFAGILSKFERSARVKAAAATGHAKDETPDTELNTAEPVIAQGLEPIPQPEPVPEQDVKPTYSSLPPWLANPLRTSAEARAKFSDLGIEPKLLRVLDDNGYKEAFAVQSAVIPLLLKGPKNHSGDLCVSAATGSGKTLSYVLPLVTELEHIPAPRLRGLIVVPTRELVKQAREACEFCTAGSGLRVGSAVGNVAIKDEQRSLMRVDQIYSPESVKSRQQAELTGDDWTDFSLQDYISSTTDLGEALPGYVHKVEPNVDILICTPGRLVDHIRYTKGFTLKHLQWLVIDEADRLLNESFQEWVDVVINSLDARKAPGAFGSSGQFLTDLGLPLQVREPRKVILSATMTRDISKLNTLRLANPRLVVVGQIGTEEDGVNARLDEKFTLPTTLKEHSIAVGDESQKPLYLLRLLVSEIKIDVPSSGKRSKSAASARDDSSSEETSSDDTSSDDTSSDDTSSDESSSEDSSSESDSDSDSDTSDASSSSKEDDSSNSSSDSDSDSNAEEPTKPSSKQNSQRTTVLVFAKSSESASRLSRLLALLDPSLSGLIGTIIKSNKSSASRKTLTAYRSGKLSIIIATDRASRGLDLPSLTHVVNYDVPTSVTTYVHRVGRTARADKEGSAWTLVAHREGRWFTNEIAKVSDGKIVRSSKVERVAMKLENMKDVKSRYAAALDVLEMEVKTDGTKKGVPS
ncbi:P-loop containing nucleoside triphosphate hydrolase protein [Aspergillus cavernicola]|uniref:ATP-dependent RNA helicase n=1 Tax=Aspergillus cavernicola TaxID=176166 RepID=A0ABR4IIP8_9EURO